MINPAHYFPTGFFPSAYFGGPSNANGQYSYIGDVFLTAYGSAETLTTVNQSSQGGGIVKRRKINYSYTPTLFLNTYKYKGKGWIFTGSNTAKTEFIPATKTFEYNSDGAISFFGSSETSNFSYLKLALLEDEEFLMIA